MAENRRKRAHGEGTIRRRSDGRFEARVSLPDGRRKSVYGRTRKEVVAKMDEARQLAARGIGTTSTVGEYLDRWLAEIARVKSTTAEGYESAIRLHIKPVIGEVRLEKLSAADVHRLMKSLEGKPRAQQSRRPDAPTPPPLSPRTRQFVHAVLSSALSQARKWRLVAENVAEYVDPPSVSNQSGRPFSVDEARRVVSASRGHRLEALYGVALPMGIRQGQAVALDRDADLDLETMTLHVRHTMQRAGGEWVMTPIGSNKGGKTAAALPLPAAWRDILVAHLERQDLERAWAGQFWTDPEVVDEEGRRRTVRLLFCRPDGQPMHSSSLLADFHRLCDAAGVERRRFHDLRHSCGSMLIAQGVPQRVVMSVLRHSTMAMSARYTEQVDEVVRTAVDQLGEALRVMGDPKPDPNGQD